MMKPSGILLYIISVFLLLIAVALCFPKEGINISGDLKLQFFSPVEVFSGNREVYADIDDILLMQALFHDSILRENPESQLPESYPDIRIDDILESITRIEYPDWDSTLLYPFFSSLYNLGSSGELIRILHYGDSQIENDRITSFLRNKLQNRFGGSGVGLVPVAPLYSYGFSVNQTYSENWNRYVVCGNRDTSLKHNRYGVLACFGTYNPSESYAGDDKESIEAWVRFEPSPYSYQNTRNFRQCRIYYGYNQQPFIVEVYLRDELIDAEMLPVSHELMSLQWKFEDPQEELMLRFTGNASPEIYGIALDDNRGIAVDNIPLRGCSGPFINNIDQELLQDMYGKLKVKLIILQFGGNMVPAEIENFNGYENWYVNQISRIREACPGATILVIGVADMSVKEKDQYVTASNVEKVRNALKNAAFRSDAAFWDMYEAMGGRNSMPSWVNAEPSLAAADFVHFNPLGAKTIAQLLYNALILEYQRFEKHYQK